MEGRISALLLTLPLAALCAGCVTTNGPKNASDANFAGMPDTPKVVKKDPGPKRVPLSSTEVAIGQMKEMEAETDAAQKQPEAQARLRDEARVAYQRALQIDPQNIDAQRRLGQLYAKIGDYQRAFEIYRQAMAKNPQDARLWYDLGMCHKRRQDFPEAARCFQKALQMDPENREYMKKLGFTLAWMERYDEGLAWLTRAHGAALAHFHIARVLGLKDHVEHARQHLLLARRDDGTLMDEARALLDALDRSNANGGRVGALGGPSAGG